MVFKEADQIWPTIPVNRVELHLRHCFSLCRHHILFLYSFLPITGAYIAMFVYIN